MEVKVDFGVCDTNELLNIYDDVRHLILERCKNGGYIFNAKNGNIYPRRCEHCDGPVTMICNKLNLTQREVEAVKNSSEFGEPYERWYNFLRRLIKEGKFEMPPNYVSLYPIEVSGPGEWYCAYCPCRFGDWKQTYDEAVESWWNRPIVKCQ